MRRSGSQYFQTSVRMSLCGRGPPSNGGVVAYKGERSEHRSDMHLLDAVLLVAVIDWKPGWEALRTHHAQAPWRNGGRYSFMNSYRTLGLNSLSAARLRRDRVAYGGCRIRAPKFACDDRFGGPETHCVRYRASQETVQRKLELNGRFYGDVHAQALQRRGYYRYAL